MIPGWKQEWGGKLLPKGPHLYASLIYTLVIFTMTQNENDFTRLLHQSQQLCAKIYGTRSIPTIYRGLEQLEAFSSKLIAKTGLMSTEVR